MRLDATAEDIRLVRVLGLMLLEGHGETPQQYCCCVVMKLVRKGYLPFDRYRYLSIRSGIAGDDTRVPDIRLFHIRRIVDPAFCISSSPQQFQHVDDLTRKSESFYCIPPSRVLSRFTDYEHLCLENSVPINSFREVTDMNAINSSLEEEVGRYTESVARKKRRAQERRTAQAAQERADAAGKRGATRRRTPAFYDSDSSDKDHAGDKSEDDNAFL